MDTAASTERKIFVLSLHRTGTHSVHYLLVRARFRSVHWPSEVDGIDYESRIAGREDDPDFIADALAPVFARFTAVSDVPIPVLYEILDVRFPHALFIAVRRNAAEWASSVRRHHFQDLPLRPFVKAQYFRYLRSRPERISAITDDELLQMHDRHYDGLVNYFRGRRNFALFDLSDSRLGENICSFLGVPPLKLPKIDLSVSKFGTGPR